MRKEPKRIKKRQEGQRQHSEEMKIRTGSLERKLVKKKLAREDENQKERSVMVTKGKRNADKREWSAVLHKDLMSRKPLRVRRVNIWNSKKEPSSSYSVEDRC